MKQIQIDNWSLYEGKLVEEVRQALAETHKPAEGNVVAIMHQGAVLLETDAIPDGEKDPVAKIMTEAQYNKGIIAAQRLRSLTVQHPEIIYVEPVQPVIEEAPKKANIDQIDLSQYKGQTVEQARYQISLLVDVPETHVVAIFQKSSALKDTDILPEELNNLSLKLLKKAIYKNALSAAEKSFTTQTIDAPHEQQVEPVQPVIEEAPKKANIDQIDLSQYKGQTVEQARYQISLLVDVPETHVVAIMHQSAVLLETDAIPAGEPNPVAKIMTEAQYTRGVQSTERLRSSTGQEPEIIYVEPVQPVIEEAPKKANIDQIDLSQYKGQTVEQARYQISLLVDVPQDKTIVFWHQTELLLDTAFLDDISQPKAAFMYIGRYEALTKPKTHNAFKFLDIAGNLVTVNDVNTLDDAITKHFGNNTKVNHYPNKMALHIDNNYSDYRFYMGAYNFYKCEDKVCPVDASFKFESEIQAAIEDQLSTHEERVSVNVDVKNRAYEIEHDPRVTCQVAVEGGNTISKKCKLSDINNIKDELKADRAFSEYHLILDNNAPTELRHRSTLKFQTLRKTECSIFKKADGNIQEIIIENNTPVYTQITKQFFHPFSKDGIGISEIEPIEGNDYTESDFYISNNVIKVQTSNKPITYQYADAKVFENKDTDLLKALGSDIDLNSLVKFSTRDGQITFLIKQNKSGNDEYDMNIIAVRGFGLDTATQLLGEDGLSVRLDERNDHDYRNHKFYRAYSLIKIELSNKNFIYADAEKFRGADNKLKDALKKRLKNQNEVESEIQIDLTWDTNKTTCTASKSIVKPCTASKSIVKPCTASKSIVKNNSTKHMLLSLDSGTTTVILSHLASTYLEVEVHPTAKIILGAAVAYGVYSHLEKQQGPETSL